MTEPTITQVAGWEALDSRGRPTVACTVRLASGATGRAVVPSGASTGTREAVELRDGGPRYEGLGVSRAVTHVNTVLRDKARGIDGTDQSALDAALEECDPDRNLATVGANAILAVSLATLNAAADHTREPLWSHASRGAPSLPMPMVNILSGGAHAGGAIDIQDVLVVPLAARSFSEAMEMASAVRAATADLMDARGWATSLIADEGGLAAPLKSNRAAIELVTEAIARSGLRPGKDASIAVDLAANQMARDGSLFLASENRLIDYPEWIFELETWVDEYPIISFEDVLPDHEWDAWQVASVRLAPRVQLLGDDLFATNTALLRRGINQRIGNAILVKLNQAGTVTRALRAVETAELASYATVISARSGDTEDTWLADLAVGWGTGQIKVGSTMRSERTAKWNRLLEIEAETTLPLTPFPSLPSFLPESRPVRDSASVDRL